MRKFYVFGSVILISSLIFVATLIISMLMTNATEEIREQAKLINELKQNNILENVIDSNVEIVTTSVKDEEKTSPNCVFEFRTYYSKCEHTITEREEIPYTMVNKTKEDLESIYKTWNIITFNNKEVIFAKEVNSECEEHYLVKDLNGYISIYNINENDKETLLSTTEITTNYLPQEDKEKLKEGIRVDTNEKLNKLLEDYE